MPVPPRKTRDGTAATKPSPERAYVIVRLEAARSIGVNTCERVRGGARLLLQRACSMIA
jgi:hypothetical protein